MIDDAPIDAEPPLGDAPALSLPCTDALADVYTLPGSLPAMDDSHRGDVFRCAVTEKLNATAVRAQIAAYWKPHAIACAAKASGLRAVVTSSCPRQTTRTPAASSRGSTGPTAANRLTRCPREASRGAARQARKFSRRCGA